MPFPDRAPGVRPALFRAQTIGLGQDLDRVLGGAPGALANLQARERTVGGDGIRTALGDFLKNGSSDLHRQRKVFGLHAPGSVVTGAPLDGEHFRAGYEFQEVSRFETDVLDFQVTGKVVEDFARAAAEVQSQAPLDVTAHQILTQIDRRIRDLPAPLVRSEERILLAKGQAARWSGRDDRVAGLDEGAEGG